MSAPRPDVLALFEQALALAPEQRTQFLEAACDQDRVLFDRVQKMLGADARAHALLDRAPGALVAGLAQQQLSWWEGRELGPYRLVREIGRGGMGVVYLAERGDVGARVAIKLLASNFASPGRVERFQYERRLLARLEHPNIARFLDAGVAEDGTPWLAMEYVEGRPIDAHSDARCLTLNERLVLIESVAEAVADAHRNLLIHRDLKPSNVLVSDAGVPKLVDFGIAKLVFDGAAEGITEDPALRPLTPEYASPEQVRSEPLTTASDVYQLGIVLHELLTGRRPARRDGEPLRFFDRAAAVPMMRPSVLVSMEVTPQQVSSGVTSRTAAELSALRRSTPSRLRRQLAGDLDTIIETALHPDPARRYATARELAEDLRRFRQGRPIVARKASLSYRLVKLVGRHRIAAGLAASLVAIVAVSAITLVMQSGRVTRERDRAEQVAAVLQRLVLSSDPSRGQTDSAAARAVLRDVIHEARAGLPVDPATWGRILVLVSSVYRNMGQVDSMIALSREAVHALEGRVAASDALLLDAQGMLGTGLVEAGRFDEGLAVLARMLGRARQLPDDKRAQFVESLYNVAFGRQMTGDDVGARQLYDEVLRLTVTLPDSGEIVYDRTLLNMGYLSERQGRPDDAEPYFRHALARRVIRDGPEHERTLNAMAAVARITLQRGNLAEASVLADTVLTVRRRLFTAPNHPLADALDLRAAVLLRQGQLEAAEIVAREAWAAYRAAYDNDHLLVAYAESRLANVLEQRDRLDEAGRLRRASVALYRRTGGHRHPATADAIIDLAMLEARLGRTVEAEALFREAMPVLDSIRAGRAVLAGPLTAFGELLVETNRCAEAEVYLRRAVELARNEWPVGDERVSRAETLLNRCTAIELRLRERGRSGALARR